MINEENKRTEKKRNQEVDGRNGKMDKASGKRGTVLGSHMAILGPSTPEGQPS